jgi:hypothetical protein
MPLLVKVQTVHARKLAVVACDPTRTGGPDAPINEIATIRPSKPSKPASRQL